MGTWSTGTGLIVPCAPDCGCSDGCCECVITIGVANACGGTTQAIDLYVDELDCSGNPSGYVHTFSAFSGATSTTTFCYNREDSPGAQKTVEFTIEAMLECQMGYPKFFSYWYITGYPDNTGDFENEIGGSGYCYYGQTLPLDLLQSGTCSVTAIAHFADLILTHECECCSCYIDAENIGVDCPCEDSTIPVTPCRDGWDDC